MWKSLPRIVSPAAGILGVRQTRSMLIEPMTTMGFDSLMNCFCHRCGKDDHRQNRIQLYAFVRRGSLNLVDGFQELFAIHPHLVWPHAFDLLQRLRIARCLTRDELERAVVADAIRRQLA